MDRKNTNLPYLKKYKDNLVFISHRANRIKSNASVEEIVKVLEYMNKESNARHEKGGIGFRPIESVETQA